MTFPRGVLLRIPMTKSGREKCDRECRRFLAVTTTALVSIRALFTPYLGYLKCALFSPIRAIDVNYS